MTSNLIHLIQAAQVRAGEAAVMAHLDPALRTQETPVEIENHHHKIKGARLLSAEEVALMNEGKDLAEQVGAFIAKLRLHGPQRTPAGSDVYIAPQEPQLDQRWISIGATHLQEGFMAVIRGIAQPTTF